MNILQLCPRVPFPPHDGGSIAMVRMTEGLQENGCWVRVMCYNTSKHPVDTTELDPELVKKTGLKAVHLDNKVRPFDALVQLIRNRSYHLSRFSNRLFRDELENLLKHETFDAFILESIFLWEAIPILRRYSDAPVILRAHNVEFGIWKGLASTEGNPIKKWYMNRLANQLEKEEKRIIASVDGILAITQEDANLFGKLVPSVPVLVSPAGIDAEKYSWNRIPDPLLVAHIGAMDWPPNIEGIQWFLNDVWPKVSSSVPESRLALAGKNMPEHFFRYNGRNVLVQGFVADAEKFLFEAGIVVIPLLNGSGMRIKLLEALAMGKAVVTTPIGCEGIPVTDGMDVIIAGTADRFADALIGLLSDTEKQARLRTSARDLASNKFNTAVIGLQTVHFVQKLKTSPNQTQS